jgi:transposase InsO family protein
MQHHRGRSRPPVSRPREHVADGPWQLGSWDITYLRSRVRGQFFYLYLVEDVWSRMIIGWEVHDIECNELAAALIERIRRENPGVDLRGWVLHSDNGGPMKGATMLATLQRLGVVPSFSRPSVSDDNPFVESLFRTLKYCPEYPSSGFACVEQARLWVAKFVAWYNNEHQHSGIGFVTPAARHAGDDVAILAARRDTYARARARHPERWSRHTRAWKRPATVTLNPENHTEAERLAS